jgi:hypothetical protein
VASGWAGQLGRFARASRGHYRALAIGEGRATSLIRQIKAKLALNKGEEGVRSQGDLAPAAGPGLCLDAAANALGDLQAGQRTLEQEADTEEGGTAWGPVRPCRRVSR